MINPLADPIEELLRGRLDWAAPLNLWRWRTATVTLREIGVERPTHGEAAKAGAIIRRMNGGHSRRSGGRNLSLVPPRPDVAHFDDENPEWTEGDFARALRGDEIPAAMREAFGKGKPGRPFGSTKANAKQSVTIRLDPDVLAAWRGSGPGWQSRVNDALRKAAP